MERKIDTEKLGVSVCEARKILGIGRNLMLELVKLHSSPAVRFKRRLLEHKEKQQKLFKTYKKKWNEKKYIFLNQYRKPFVPGNLSGNMKKFIEKYNLEHMRPYGLRHSFAYFCSEKIWINLFL